MCGKCERPMAKAATGLGILSLVLAVATRLGHCGIANVGPRSFAAAAVILLLLTIALNTCPHSHEGSPPA